MVCSSPEIEQKSDKRVGWDGCLAGPTTEPEHCRGADHAARLRSSASKPWARKSRLNECLRQPPLSGSVLIAPICSHICARQRALLNNSKLGKHARDSTEKPARVLIYLLIFPVVFYQSNVPALVEQDSQLDPELGSLGSTPRTSTGPRHRRLDLGPRSLPFHRSSRRLFAKTYTSVPAVPDGDDNYL